MKKVMVGSLAAALVFANGVGLAAAKGQENPKSKSKKVVKVDKDRNGIPDDWQKKFKLGNGKPIAAKDFDKDGLNNLQEYQLNLNPRLKDTDKDGILDGNEDQDKDQLANAIEIKLGYNPVITDTDQDGISDGNEDYDQDGIYNSNEIVTLEIQAENLDDSEFELKYTLNGKLKIEDQIGIANPKTIVDRLVLTPNMTEDEVLSQVNQVLGAIDLKDLKIEVKFGNGSELKGQSDDDQDSQAAEEDEHENED